MQNGPQIPKLKIKPLLTQFLENFVQNVIDSYCTTHNSIKFGYWAFKSSAKLDEATLRRRRQNVYSKKLITVKNAMKNNHYSENSFQRLTD